MQYAYLPPMEDEEQARIGAKGWPTVTEGAVVFGSSTLISRSLAGVPRFGMTPEMRSYFQRRIVLWASVRDWKRAAQHDQLVGKTIRAVDDTGERHPESGALFKVALGDGQDDEVTVGIVLRPPIS